MMVLEVGKSRQARECQGLVSKHLGLSCPSKYQKKERTQHRDDAEWQKLGNGLTQPTGSRCLSAGIGNISECITCFLNILPECNNTCKGACSSLPAWTEVVSKYKTYK